MIWTTSGAPAYAAEELVDILKAHAWCPATNRCYCGALVDWGDHPRHVAAVFQSMSAKRSKHPLPTEVDEETIARLVAEAEAGIPVEKLHPSTWIYQTND